MGVSVSHQCTHANVTCTKHQTYKYTRSLLSRVFSTLSFSSTLSHTHTHIYIFIYAISYSFTVPAEKVEDHHFHQLKLFHSIAVPTHLSEVTKKRNIFFSLFPFCSQEHACHRCKIQPCNRYVHCAREARTGEEERDSRDIRINISCCFWGLEIWLIAIIYFDHPFKNITIYIYIYTIKFNILMWEQW